MKSGVKPSVHEHHHTEHCNHDHDHEHHHTPRTYVRPHPKVGRNEPCPCGSGKRYKQCCLE